MKRAISFLLTLVMLLALLPTCLGAEEPAELNACGPVGFKDAERITYDTAVAVTAGLGLFAGKSDGRFDPTGKVTRAQMATVMVKMLKGGGFNADSYKGAGNPFSDTAGFEGGWAEGYINACRELGVVSGYPDGTFHPEKEVTAAEALTMVINALKVDAGAGEWPTTVMNKASEMKLCDELTDQPAADKVLDREELAVVVSAGVQYVPGGSRSLLSTVFGVGHIETAHKYDEKTKLCTVCRAAMPGALTRADLEKAVVETAWAYFMKGAKLQYCSQELDKIGKLYGGHYRVNEDGAPEYGTTDNCLYAVCSDWTAKVYLNALGHRVLDGVGPLDALTACMWSWSDNQPNGRMSDGGAFDPVTEGNVDYTVMRWKRSSYVIRDYDVFMGVDKSPHFADLGDRHLNFANGYYATTPEEQKMADEAVRDFLNNWEVNLRPGDIFSTDTHALLYVGNGYILDCNAIGGGKYDLVGGVDMVEPNGSVCRLMTVEDYLTTPGKGAYLGDDGAKNTFIVLRPTNGMVIDDGDGNPANDLVANSAFAIPAGTVSREQFPAMEIDRTVSATPYGTVAAGEEVTYTIRITNCSDNALYTKYHTRYGAAAPAVDYKAVPVSETVPEGAKFVSATGDYTMNDGAISWSLDVPVGQTAEVSYTVQVDAAVGSLLTNDGGLVGDVPSNSLTNVVGGAKLSDDALTVLKQIADTDPEQWREKFNISRNTSDLDFAERIYQKMGIDLDLPTVAELAKNVFPWKTIPWKSYHLRARDRDPISVYMLNEAVPQEYQTVRDMLVRGYMGGYQFYTGAAAKGTTINEFRHEYLEAGDILVYVTLSLDGAPVNAQVLVYAGLDSAGAPTLLAIDSQKRVNVYKGEDADKRLWNAFLPGIDLFFALRPSQAVDNVNDARFDPAKEPVYGEEPVTLRPTERGTTTLDGGELSVLQSLTYKDVFGLKIKYVFNVYSKLGINGLDKLMVKAENGETLSSGTAALAEIFARVDDGGSAELHRTYALRSQADTAIGRMLVESFYGGEWLPGGGEPPEVDRLLPGDAVMLGNRNTDGKSAYADELVLVYQGNGKFLAAGHHGASVDGLYGHVTTGYSYGCLEFTDESVSGEFAVGGSLSKLGNTFRKVNDLSAADAANGYVKVDSFEDLLKRDPFTGNPWQFFFVIRPTQGVYDIHDLTYTPEAPAAN